ncbi:4-hydroxy-tetrahydrodipicolinate reductase [Devosia sp. XJ19-1]|uniref:4-hydroxy-tetrahydrodipicolinate reductase n=1 Tax=Devosia ureilytica TaxID=2952754 RepID=A0A9Q4FQW9_9HYPH|nr:4-hydroxy-tetrahydrodipicolinate reductase [Devosia ureilytica]MCP8882916.1 4-hydroxy-tetrahydrodipicolinate reductase [Devosia ureilytica]MCP8886716.1 4-hydroxy-tetrahydrodipicolinate reductase [Devosia ureilytica]
MSRLRIIVAGAGGRMGLANIAAVAAHDAVELVGALDRAGSAALGKDAGVLAGIEPLGILVSDDAGALLDGADAIIDFTAPAASVALAQLAAKKGLVHIIGTTGCSADDEAAIAAAGAAGARIVKSGNFSPGMVALTVLVERAARALGDYDVEVLEMHHNQKVDAPSGTALMLGEAAARGRNIDLKDNSVRVRDGHTGPREAGTIGFATLRGGNVIGDHMVILAGPSERIELNHRAQDRTIYANGAIKAVRWAVGQAPGLYSMADVLGLND